MQQSNRDRVARVGRRLKKALDLLSVHDGLQHSRCDVCEKMRSYAWGMGHANWEERRCGGCWARQAEVSAAEKLVAGAADTGTARKPRRRASLDQGQFAALRAQAPAPVASSAPKAPKQLPAVVQRALEALQQAEQQANCVPQGSPSQPASTPGASGGAAPAGADAARPVSAPSTNNQQQHTVTAVQPDQARAATGAAHKPGDTAASTTASMTAPADTATAVTKRGRFDRSPLDERRRALARRLAAEAHAELRAREALLAESLRHNATFPAATLAGTSATQRHAVDATQHAANTERGAVAVKAHAPAAGAGPKAAASTNMDTLVFAARDQQRGASKARQQQRGTLCVDDLYAKPHGTAKQRAASATATLRDTYTVPAAMTASQSTMQHADNTGSSCMQANAVTQSGMPHAAGSTMQRSLESGTAQTGHMQQGTAIGSGPAGADRGTQQKGMGDDWDAWERRRRWALDREAVLLLELDKCSEVLVFGATQEERSAAAYLCCQLREEIAQLARMNRRYRKELRTRMHQQRDSAAKAAQAGLSQRRAFGRLQPPETALPPAAHSNTHDSHPSSTKPVLPWTAEGVALKLQRQRAESAPHTTSQHASTQPAAQASSSNTLQPSTVARTHPPCHQDINTQPSQTMANTQTRTQRAAGNRAHGGTSSPERVAVMKEDMPFVNMWHERLYGGPVQQGGEDAVCKLSRTELYTLQCAIDEYRRRAAAAALQAPAPAGLHAEMRGAAYQAAAAEPRLVEAVTQLLPTAAATAQLSPAAGTAAAADRPATPASKSSTPAPHIVGTASHAGIGGASVIRTAEGVDGAVDQTGSTSSHPTTPTHQQQHSPHSNAHHFAEQLWVSGLPSLTGTSARRLTNLSKRLAASSTHADKLDPALQTDQVPWKPGRMRPDTLPHPTGLQAVGDWEGVGKDGNVDVSMERLRRLSVEDLKAQLSARREAEAVAMRKETAARARAIMAQHNMDT